MSPSRSVRSSGRQQARRDLSRLVAAGTDAMRRGELEAARESFAQARECAVRVGTRDDVDRADLNLAMVSLEKGEIKQAEDGLREILLRSKDRRVGFTAAYHLASSLRRQGRFDSASRYAARALERAEELNDVDLLAPIQNLLGNLMLSRSYPREAVRHYEAALSIRESQVEDTRWSRAILLDNLGYCQLLLKKLDNGLSNIRKALELATAVGDRRCIAECWQDICYGALLAGDLEGALEAGTTALSDASRYGYGDVEENCHYLLGEVGSRAGDVEVRDAHFEALQSRHPEIPFLKDFLCTVDVTGMITLKR